MKKKGENKMKKLLTIIMISLLTVTMSACSNNVPNEEGTSTNENKEETVIDENKEEEVIDENASDKKVLVAYFTLPEDVNTDGVDAIGGASIVVNEGEVLGNTQYMAQIIQNSIGGELFEIRTVQNYPRDHEPLVDQAANEQDDNLRPELSTKVENINDYDVIFIGYPNWWGDMPMPLYTFLEEYDLSGKTIVPFSTHGGSGFSNTINTIEDLQPNATVITDALTISRNNIADAASEITDWVNELDL
jgi:flavodoxin